MFNFLEMHGEITLEIVYPHNLNIIKMIWKFVRENFLKKWTMPRTLTKASGEMSREIHQVKQPIPRLQTNNKWDWSETLRRLK